MPSGHTNKATINQRRPLTPRMAAVLGELAAAPMTWAGLSEGYKNALRGLVGRGFAEPANEATTVFKITDAGMDAIK